MVVQAMWQTDSVLLQLPHFTRDLAKKCTQANISTIIAGQEEGTSLADMEVSMLCLVTIGFSCCALMLRSISRRRFCAWLCEPLPAAKLVTCCEMSTVDAAYGYMACC